MNHTPGPWTVEHIKGLDLGASAEILAGNDRRIVIAQVWKTDDNITGWSKDETGQANASLISSAPDLLALVREAFDRFTDNDMQPPNDKLKGWLERAAKVFYKIDPILPGRP